MDTAALESARLRVAIEMSLRHEEAKQESLATELSRLTYLAEEEARKQAQSRAVLHESERQRRHLQDQIRQLEIGGEDRAAAAAPAREEPVRRPTVLPAAASAAGAQIPRSSNGVAGPRKLVAKVRFGADCRAVLLQAQRLYQDETGVKITVLGHADELELEHDDVEVLKQTKSMLERAVSDPAGIQRKLKSYADERVHMFVDQSNLFIGSQKVTNASGETAMNNRVRVSAGEAVKVMADGRDVLEKHVAGSTVSDGSDAAVWQKWRDIGCKVHLEKREKGEGEQSVDDLLIAQIGLALPRFTSTEAARHTVVLVTGDGKDNKDR
jgi:hypothetical protein